MNHKDRHLSISLDILRCLDKFYFFLNFNFFKFRPEILAVNYFENCRIQLDELYKGLKYDQIELRFNYLCDQYKQAKAHLEATVTEAKKKNHLTKLCTTLKENAKKCLVNLQIKVNDLKNIFF